MVWVYNQILIRPLIGILDFKWTPNQMFRHYNIGLNSRNSTLTQLIGRNCRKGRVIHAHSSFVPIKLQRHGYFAWHHFHDHSIVLSPKNQNSQGIRHQNTWQFGWIAVSFFIIPQMQSRQYYSLPIQLENQT